MGRKKKNFTKAEDEKMLTLIEQKANMIQLEIQLNKSSLLIMKRLKQMGFDGLKDARKVMGG